MKQHHGNTRTHYSWSTKELQMFWGFSYPILLSFPYPLRDCCCLVPKSCLILLWPHGLQPTGLLCLWDFPGRNTGVGCHFLLQGIFLTQASSLCLLHCRWIPYYCATGEALLSELICFPCNPFSLSFGLIYMILLIICNRLWSECFCPLKTCTLKCNPQIGGIGTWEMIRLWG